MSTVNQCDQCGKIQNGHFNILLKIAEELSEENQQRQQLSGVFWALTNAPRFKTTDLEFCSFDCVALMAHMLAAQERVMR